MKRRMLTSQWRSSRGMNVLIAVHTAEQPSPEEWDVYASALKTMAAADPGFEQTQGITFTDGGAPNMHQRRQLTELLGQGTPARGAIFSDSTIVRGVVTAISWLTGGVRAFSPGRPCYGLQHLDVARSDWPALIAHLRTLSDQMPECRSLQKALEAFATGAFKSTDGPT